MIVYSIEHHKKEPDLIVEYEDGSTTPIHMVVAQFRHKDEATAYIERKLSEGAPMSEFVIMGEEEETASDVDFGEFHTPRYPKWLRRWIAWDRPMPFEIVKNPKC